MWAEQNPEEWWGACVASVRAVLEQIDGEVAGVGLTGQMHGLVLLDEAGSVLRPCIMWNDQRTATQCEAITDRVGRETVLRLTGNPVLPGFTAPKIEWVRDHEPDVYRRIAHVLLPKDYVRYRLTGGFCSDVSDASGTSLFDVGRRVWSATMLEALDIQSCWMPEVHESPEVCGRINQLAAKELGLKEGTPVVAGAGDQAAQAVGTGIVEEGLVSVTIGPSGVVFAASDTYRADEQGRLHAFCHAVPGQWHLMGVMLSAGGSFRWYRDTFGDDGGYAQLIESARSVPAGSEGLFFLPYLSGERTPHPDPDARGVWFGLTLRHTRSHLVRSLLEGVPYGLRDSFELMRDLDLPIDQVRVSGGGAASPFWRQLFADVLNQKVSMVNTSEGAAYGAALLAAVGVGVYPSVGEACRGMIREAEMVEPSDEAGVYAEGYGIYRDLYPALKESFGAVGRLQARG